MTLQQVQRSTTQLLRPSPGQRTTGHKVTLVKEKCRFDNEKVLILMENNKCMEKHSVNMFKTESTDSYLTRTGYTPRWKSVGLSFCQLASLSACNLELVIVKTIGTNFESGRFYFVLYAYFLTFHVNLLMFQT